jgi:iron(III) transport system substrate-binding protein
MKHSAIFMGSLLWLLPSFSLVYSAEKGRGWDQLVEAARREGTVTIYAPRGFERRGAGMVTEPFQKAYPGITVRTNLGGGDLVNRILTERRADRYIPDILIGGTSTALLGLKPARALQPLASHLILPEVLDPSGWLTNRLWWADAQEPYTTLMFLGYVQSMGAVNTRLANPSEFASYWDFLNPKWKGKIVAHDIRRGGTGGVVVRFIYKHPQLGPRYLERLFSEMDIALTGDVRQTVDFLAIGRYSIGLFVGSENLLQAQEQGLPVALVPAEQLKEGSPIAPSGGAVSLLDRAPHPNAAKLFINWLLSREGQIAYQESIALPSLRTDIPKTGLYSFDVPKAGVQYAAGGSEEYSRIGADAIRDVVTKALAKAGRQ